MTILKKKKKGDTKRMDNNSSFIFSNYYRIRCELLFITKEMSENCQTEEGFAFYNDLFESYQSILKIIEEKYLYKDRNL